MRTGEEMEATGMLAFFASRSFSCGTKQYGTVVVVFVGVVAIRWPSYYHHITTTAIIRL